MTAMAPHLSYIGYVEGRDINRAKADVIVTDGFTGNVALKTMEGFAAFLLGNLREVFDHGLLQRLAFLLVRKYLGAIRSRLDPAEYGGAPLLGVDGVAIIAHGSSSPVAIRNAIRAAANEAVIANVNAEITETLLKVAPVSAIKPATDKGLRGLFSKMRERLRLNREAGQERRPGSEVELDRVPLESERSLNGAGAKEPKTKTSGSLTKSGSGPFPISAARHEDDASVSPQRQPNPTIEETTKE
jgi:Fatty acid synthesis protein